MSNYFSGYAILLCTTRTGNRLQRKMQRNDSSLITLKDNFSPNADPSKNRPTSSRQIKLVLKSKTNTLIEHLSNKQGTQLQISPKAEKRASKRLQTTRPSVGFKDVTSCVTITERRLATYHFLQHLQDSGCSFHNKSKLRTPIVHESQSSYIMLVNFINVTKCVFAPLRTINEAVPLLFKTIPVFHIITEMVDCILARENVKIFNRYVIV